MKNKIKKIIILLLSVLIIYFVLFWIQNMLAWNTFEKYNEEKLGEETNSFLIRCNYNIFDPEYAYTFYLDNKGEIAFEKPTVQVYKIENWENSYVGGTTIKNTDFNTLLKIVKEDCYQFQKDYDNPKVNEGGIDWGYREASINTDTNTENQFKTWKFKMTEENLKKIEKYLREQTDNEEEIQKELEYLKTQEEVEIGINLNRIKLDD